MRAPPSGRGGAPLRPPELPASARPEAPSGRPDLDQLEATPAVPARPMAQDDGPATPVTQRAALSGPESARLATLGGAAAAQLDPGLTPASPADKRAFLDDLLSAYYPVDHPRLHVSEAPLDLDALAVGRKDETGRLRRVALAPPYALGGEWRHPPLAKEKGFHFDLNRALTQHAALTRYLLDRGVEVHLQIHGERASEAVYATDSVTGIGNTAFVGNPKHGPRKLETTAYTGGTRLADFGGADGPIEFGDVLLFHDGRQQVVLQGFNSWRGTEASLRGMQAALDHLHERGAIDPPKLVPVKLSGDGTLHLDYVLNYAGPPDRRVIVAYPEGLADPKQLDSIAELLGVPPERVIRVDKEEMENGAANLSSLSDSEVLYIDNEHSRRVADAMRELGLTVTQFPYDQMSDKDGTLHCSIGQLARD